MICVQRQQNVQGRVQEWGLQQGGPGVIRYTLLFYEPMCPLCISNGISTGKPKEVLYPMVSPKW